jgi:regulator of sigma D
MKYINKSIAEQTAHNMLKSVNQKISEKQKELSDFCQDLAIKSIDSNVWENVSSIPEGWIQKRSTFYFKSYYSSIQIGITSAIRFRYDSYSINVSNEDFEKIKSFEQDIKNMENKRRQLREQIIESLLKLRTAKRIEKEFPEAYKCLPKDVMQIHDIVALPFKKILTGINDFPE